MVSRGVRQGLRRSGRKPIAAKKTTSGNIRGWKSADAIWKTAFPAGAAADDVA